MALKPRLILEPVHQPGDEVIIRGLERPGRVSLLRYDGHQVEFFVHWWDEGKRAGEWMYADELYGVHPEYMRAYKATL